MSTKEAKREVYFILFTFVLLGVFAFGLLTSLFYQTKSIYTLSTTIYNHPLQVSNAASNLKSEILKIHRDMKKILLHPSQEELQNLIKKTKQHEEHISKYMSVIEKNILGDEGRVLERDTKKLLDAWRKVRSKIVLLIEKNQIEKARLWNQDKKLDNLLQLEISLSKIYEYAQNKAMGFKKESDTVYKDFVQTEFLTVGMFLLLFSFMVYYTMQRISKYINKNEHLRDVLAVIRDVNQLIVRQKEKQKLIQECCDILTANHVFENAWIGLFDAHNKIAFMSGSDAEKDFILLQEKMKSEWTPHCIKKTMKSGDNHSHIENTDDECLACPLVGSHGGYGAFNIVLQYNGHIYGHLTLSLEKKYLRYSDEMSLLEEVAGDIAYALYNIDVEKSVVELKELYGNIIDSAENLIFVKDTHFNYLACNRAFEKFIGKSKNEIIGKNDYDIHDKDKADFFREHDIRVLAEKKAKSNFEWVTCPDGTKVYLFTVKSPLINSQGEVIGLVGNSADLTQQKHTEISLQESEKKFKLLMKESPSVIEIYDLEGNQVEVNNAYEKLWGIPASSTLNKFNLFKSEEVERTGLLEYIKRAYLGETVEVPVYEFDVRGATEAHGQGRVRKLNTRIYPLKDASGTIKNIVITHEDVTDKENSFIALKQKKKELETIIKEAPNPIIIHSDDGKILMLNQAWLNAIGYTIEDTPTVDKFIDKIYPEADINKVMKEHIYSLYNITSKIDEGEFTFMNKSGEKITLQFSSAPLGIIDGKRTVISSAMDITELKKKDELMIAQSRHAAMGEMIGMIAHQWRQPISVVSMIANNMLLDLELDEFDAKDAQKYSEDILEQTSHLSKTIDDFRNFFKPDKAKSMVAMQNIIDETFTIVKDSLVNNSIECNVQNNSTSKVEVYPREVMQVFVNIITNAKDALVHNKVENAKIDIFVNEDKDYVTIKICDNGGGIDKKILSKIFDPYFTTKDEKTGTGLGLYMSKTIIEKHLKGVLEVFNESNGACFTVKLPKVSQ